MRDYRKIRARMVQKVHADLSGDILPIDEIFRSNKYYTDMRSLLITIFDEEGALEIFDRAFYYECTMYLAQRCAYSSNKKIRVIVNYILNEVNTMSYEKLISEDGYGISIVNAVETLRLVPIEDIKKYHDRIWQDILNIVKERKSDFDDIQNILYEYLNEYLGKL